MVFTDSGGSKFFIAGFFVFFLVLFFLRLEFGERS